MTERLSDISARIEGIRQLGAVVNAMKGIAAARSHVARNQVATVDAYAATIAAAMVSAMAPNPAGSKDRSPAEPEKNGLLIFCAEQGFAGAFSERVFDAVGTDLIPENLFLIGTRGLSIATARGITPHWSGPLPSHTAGIPKLADKVTAAIYEAVTTNRITRLEVVFTGWTSGRPKVLRHSLFPIDLSNLGAVGGDRPLTQIPDGDLLDSLGQDFFHAQVCKAALHAFAAENEARMEAMSSAGGQIKSELEAFQDKLRRVRQEAITAEIIELGTGAAAAR